MSTAKVYLRSLAAHVECMRPRSWVGGMRPSVWDTSTRNEVMVISGLGYREEGMLSAPPPPPPRLQAGQGCPGYTRSQFRREADPILLHVLPPGAVKQPRCFG